MRRKIWKRAGAVLLALTMMAGGALTASAADESKKSDKVIDPNQKVTLTIHKYEMEAIPDDLTAGNGLSTGVNIPSGAKPLEGVTFSLYKVAADYSDPETIPQDVEPIEGTTNASGTYVFGEGDTKLEQGRYLVVESETPAHVYEKTPNFLVDLPMVKPDGTGWNYNVHVYPKNAAVLGSAVLTKLGEGDDAKALAGATFKLQQKQADGTYKDVVEKVETNAKGNIVLNNLLKGEYQLVEISAPEGYGLNEKPVTFTIDKNGETKVKADKSLEKIGTVVEVELQNYKLPADPEKEVNKETAAAGEEVVWTITPGIPTDIASYKEYKVTDTVDSRLTVAEDSAVKVMAGDTDITEKCGVTVVNREVTVDLIGAKEDIAGKTVTITITTTVNEGVLDNPGSIKNEAEVSYENQYGTKGSKKTGVVDVFTGNVKVVKSNESDEKLAGASFVLYGSLKDAQEGKNPIAAEQTTDKNGLAYFKGLKAGTYYLVETKAPTYEKDGQTLSYNLMTEPKEVVLEATDEDGVVEVSVVNKKQGFSIPVTGSSATLFFICLGAMLISGCVIVSIYRKKRAMQ